MSKRVINHITIMESSTEQVVRLFNDLFQGKISYKRMTDNVIINFVVIYPKIDYFVKTSTCQN